MTTRRVFFSFDFDDIWRVNQVRNSQQFLDASGFVDAAEFEKVKRQGDAAIRSWIDDQMHGASVTAVLIGSKTHKSSWVHYEICQSKKLGMGIFGIRINNILDKDRKISPTGPRPCAFTGRVYEWFFDDGRKNIPRWIEAAAKAAGR